MQNQHVLFHLKRKQKLVFGHAEFKEQTEQVEVSKVQCEELILGTHTQVGKHVCERNQWKGLPSSMQELAFLYK